MSKKAISIDPLDLLLLTNQIDFFEHKSGLEFRRLYHIANGGIHLKSSFPSLHTTKSSSLTDAELGEYRERYCKNMHQLGKYKKMILDICVFNIVPEKFSEIKAAFGRLDRFTTTHHTS